jgi:uncharacterized iron-regulated membrane protein
MAGRALWVILHRWAGLSLALFLILCGLTGSALAWLPELERLTAPSFHTAPAGPALDPLQLRAMAEEASGGRVDFARLQLVPGDSLIVPVERWPGAPAPGFDEIALDPTTGAVLGTRTWGDIREGAVNLMPFLYRLHYSLALGDTGVLILGIAALVWTLDCFIGWYLTLPRGRTRFWPRWRKAWGVSLASGPRTNFDLHRAGGLWLWPILLMFAWSSVGFNLPQVFNPVMTAALGPETPWEQPPDPLAGAPDWAAAERQAAAHLAAAAASEGFGGERLEWLRLDREAGLWIAGFRSDRDIQERYAGGRLAFSAHDGALRYLNLPTGQSGRATVESWLFGLHMGLVLGTPWRIAVTAIGLGIVLLAATGVLIWTRKRTRAGGRRAPLASGRAAPAGEPVRVRRSVSA